MQKKDIPRITELETLCFQVPWTQKDILYEYEKNDFSKQYIVKNNRQIIGYAFVWELFDHAELVRIGIEPDYRGHGFSKPCLLKAMAHAKENECATMSLEVRVSNRVALHLYKKCGFQYVHTSRRHYDDGEDAYVMVAQL